MRSRGSLPVWAFLTPSAFGGEGCGEGCEEARGRRGLGAATRDGSSRWDLGSGRRSGCRCSARCCSGRLLPDRRRPPRRRGLERLGASPSSVERGGEGRAVGGAADSAFGGEPAGPSLFPDLRQGRNRERPFGEGVSASVVDMRVAGIGNVQHPVCALERRRVIAALGKIHGEKKEGRTLAAPPLVQDTVKSGGPSTQQCSTAFGGRSTKRRRVDSGNGASLPLEGLQRKRPGLPPDTSRNWKGNDSP